MKKRLTTMLSDGDRNNIVYCDLKMQLGCKGAFFRSLSRKAANVLTN